MTEDWLRWLPWGFRDWLTRKLGAWCSAWSCSVCGEEVIFYVHDDGVVYGQSAICGVCFEKWDEKAQTIWSAQNDLPMYIKYENDVLVIEPSLNEQMAPYRHVCDDGICKTCGRTVID